MNDDDDNDNDEPAPRLNPERARRFVSEPGDFVVELPEDRSDDDSNADDDAPKSDRPDES